MAIMFLHMNWENLSTNLSFTDENRTGNLHEIRMLIFQTQRMRYSIWKFINELGKIFSTVLGKI